MLNKTLKTLLLISLFAYGTAVAGAGKTDKILSWAAYMPWQMPGSFVSYSGMDISVSQFPENLQAAFRKEVKMAEKYDVDGFCVMLSSYNGSKSFGRKWVYLRMLKAAQGTNFYINPNFDHLDNDPELVGQHIVNLVKAVGDKPNVYRDKGRVVFFAYRFARKPPEFWKKLKDYLKKHNTRIAIYADIQDDDMAKYPGGLRKGIINKGSIEKFKGLIDAAYIFGAYFKPKENIKAIGSAAKDMGIPFLATVCPGYLGAKYRWRNEYYVPYNGLGEAAKQFSAGLPFNPRGIYLTTWNDWDETPLMPSMYESDSRLRIIKYYKQRMQNNGKEIIQPRPEIFVSYKRELLAGDDLSLSIQHLPWENAPAELTLKLQDRAGKMLGQTVVKMNPAKEELIDAEIPGGKLVDHDTFRVIVEYNGKSYLLPPVMVNVSRLDSTGVWTVPLSDRAVQTKNADNIKFSITRKNGFTSGRVSAKFGEKISSAMVFRDTMPVFSLDGKNDKNRYAFQTCTDAVGNRYSDIWNLGSAGHQRTILIHEGKNCKLIRASAFYASENFGFHKTGNGKKYLQYMQGSRTPGISFEVEGTPDSTIVVESYGHGKKEVRLGDLSHSRLTLFTFGKGNFAIRPFAFDPAPCRVPVIDANEIKSEFKFSDNYHNCVSAAYLLRIELVDGKVYWSLPEYPNSSGKMVQTNILLSGRGYDEDFGSSIGRYKYSPSQVESFSVPDSMTDMDSYDVSVKSGRCLYNTTGRFNGRMYGSVTRTEYKGRPALKMGGKKFSIKLPPRSEMNGAETIKVEFAPDKTGKTMTLYADKAGMRHHCVMLIQIDKKGFVTVNKFTVKKEIKNVKWLTAVPEKHFLRSRTKVKFGEWNTLTVNYDLKKISINLNGQESGSIPVPPQIIRSNTWPVLGARSGKERFQGYLGNVSIAGYAK